MFYIKLSKVANAYSQFNYEYKLDIFSILILIKLHYSKSWRCISILVIILILIKHIFIISETGSSLLSKTNRVCKSLYKSNRMSVSFCMCVYLPNDLSNRWTEMVLFYSVASHSFMEYITNFGEGITFFQSL